MGAFFKRLWDSETLFVRFVKMGFAASAIVLTGLAPALHGNSQIFAQVGAGICASLSVFIPAGDVTPQVVKDLAARTSDLGSVVSTSTAISPAAAAEAVTDKNKK